jgi:vacuolar-type H+-ATPase subunit I/STV1
MSATLLETQNENKLEVSSDAFSFTTKYIGDELDLIHDQQENVITMARQLEKALSSAEKMRQLAKIISKIDTSIGDKLTEKRKKESSMIHLINEIKTLLSEQKYEEIDKLLSSMQKKSQEKIRLSQSQLHRIRDIMNELNELYQEASGFMRLYNVLYERLNNVYNQCQEELNTEIAEEEKLHRAGEYAGKDGKKTLSSLSFNSVFSDGFKEFLERF